MGKIGKRQPQRHSNHHDSPHRNKKTVLRRQHSQSVPKNTHLRTSGKTTSNSANSDDKNNTQIKAKVPFSKWDRVLLVGEGDFSFTLSLISNYRVASIVATCFDPKDVLEQKCPGVTKTIGKLAANNDDSEYGPKRQDLHDSSDKEDVWNGFSPSPVSSVHQTHSANDKVAAAHANCTVLYGIDATKVSTTHKKLLKSHAPFTKVVFNFPHVGGLSTDVNRQVRSNQQLLVNFFNAAKSLLATASAPAKLTPYDSEDSDEEAEYDSDSIAERSKYLEHGQILVTLFEGAPYTLWNIRDLARHSGLKVLESFKFPWSAYPGYQHARTVGDITSGKDRSEEGKRKGAWRGEERDARCYILALRDDDGGRPAPGSRKRKAVEDDSD